MASAAAAAVAAEDDEDDEDDDDEDDDDEDDEDDDASGVFAASTILNTMVATSIMVCVQLSIVDDAMVLNPTHFSFTSATQAAFDFPMLPCPAMWGNELGDAVTENFSSSRNKLHVSVARGAEAFFSTITTPSSSAMVSSFLACSLVHLES